MRRKLNLIAGTALASALFLLFHAVLALSTICWIVILIPAMFFKWDDRKEVPVRSTPNRRQRL